MNVLPKPPCLFYEAAAINDVLTVKSFVDSVYDLDCVRGSGSAGISALMVASQQGHTDTVDVLVNGGCKVNRCSSLWKRTPLMFAAGAGHFDVLKILLSHGACVNAMDRAGKTALLSAAEAGHFAIVKCLLAHGAEVNLAAGSEPLPQWVQQLLTTSDMTLTEITDLCDPYNGNNPLLKAVWKNKQHSVELLLKHKCDITFQNTGGNNALHIASREGYMNLVKLLVQFGLDVSIKNNMGETALHILCRKMFPAGEKCVQKNVSSPAVSCDIAEYLIKVGACATVTDNAEYSALSYLLTCDFLFDEETLQKQRMSLVRLVLQTTPYILPSLLPSAVSQQLPADFLPWLSQLIRTPRSLQHLSRCAIRKCLGTSRLKSIPKLGLPSHITSYVDLRM